ncbi:MAG: TonB-dependent receptor [Phycisphaerales bacterium]|nr:MAG: TonB-dependent receptor [Phycisphaerales bacterium]
MTLEKSITATTCERGAMLTQQASFLTDSSTGAREVFIHRLVRVMALAVVFLGVQSACAAASDGQEGLFDLSLEELMEVEIDTVTSASKYKQKVSEAPSSITVITADEIRKYGYRTLAEVLQSVPGFYLNYDRNYHYLGTRGFRRPGDYDTRILLLVDGHRTNENIGDSPAFGTHFLLDVDLIERVEIIRGPGSSLYGSNAFLGVINVITKTGGRIGGLELSGAVASFDTTKGRITYGETFDNGLEVLASATRYNSDGQRLYFAEFDSPDTANGLVRNDDDRFDNLVANVRWGDMSLLFAHTAREKGIPTAPWDTVFGDRRTRSWDDTTLAGLTYTKDLSKAWTVKGRLAYAHYDYDGHWVYDYADPGDPPDIVVNKDYWKGRWWEGEVQMIGQPVVGHTLTAGSEFRYNSCQDQANWDEEVYLDDSRHSHNWGLYIQDEFKVFDETTVVGGLRYDRHDTFGATANPRVAVIQNLSEDTTLKLLYGRAFRAPNAYELYYHDGEYTTKAAQNLDPETIETYEVVLEHAFTPHLSTTLSGFYYVMDDLIDQYTDPADGLLVFKNLDEVKAHGLELALNGRWDNGLRARTGYSYVNAEDDTTDRTLVNSPKHLAKLNLIVPIVDEALFAGLDIQYNSRSKTLASNHASDFVLTNLTLTYTSPSKQLELAAGVYNLFDVEYDYPGFGEHAQDVIEQDGRMFQIKLTYRF